VDWLLLLPDAFAVDIKAETQKWVKVIREQNLHID
jgi:hypothetical protein